MAKKHRTPLVLACGLALVLPTLALAGDDVPAQGSDSGMKAAIDKDGHLRAPTEEELKALSAQNKKLRTSDAPVGKATVSGHAATQPRTEREAMATYKASKSGMRTMAVPEDLMSTMTVTRTPDGKLVVSESRDHAAAAPEVADE